MTIDFETRLHDIDATTRNISSHVTKTVMTSSRTEVFAVCEIEAAGIYIDPAMAKDGKERVYVTFSVDGDERTTRFMIDDIRYTHEETVKIICKTAGAKLGETYSGRHTLDLSGNSKDVIESILSLVGLEADFTRYTSFGMQNDGYQASDITLIDAIRDILSITGAEICFDGETIVVRDMPSIAADSVPVGTFTSIEHISEFVASSSETALVDELLINADAETTVYAEPKIVVSVREYPQPLSPTEVLSFTDDETGDVYKVSPKSGVAKVFYSPIGQDVDIVGWPYNKLENYNVLETVSLSDTRIVELNGGIRKINGVEIDGVEIDGYSYEPNYNVIILDEETTGTAKISYATDIYRLVFPPSDDQYAEYSVTLSYQDRRLNYVHRYEATEYYPPMYDIKLDLIEDWYIDENDAIGASGDVYRVNPDGTETKVDTWSANVFGELDITFDDYGIYALGLSGYDNLYIQYFVNKFSKSLTKVVPG